MSSKKNLLLYMFRQKIIYLTKMNKNSTITSREQLIIVTCLRSHNSKRSIIYLSERGKCNMTELEEI